MQNHNVNLAFKYRKNELLTQVLESERDKETDIVLQAFRYLVTENLV